MRAVYFLADFFAAAFFLAAGRAALGAAAGRAALVLAVALTGALGVFFAAGFSFTSLAAAVAGFASAAAAGAATLRPKRLPLTRIGAAASNSRHSSSVSDFGSRSFGMRAF